VADRVDVRVGRFEEVLPNLSEAFDGVFLDGMHDHDSVSRDLALVAPHADRPGCWLAIHDYDVPAEWGFEVREVVDDWLAAHPEWEREGQTGKLLVLRHR